ncbi:MAG: tetratricopeptide repeat protein [Acidobacteria bacterium]|nr:tetratricopeptide repeat protein [Acidobacteriota bacterium]
MEQFTRREVVRILGVSDRQLHYWERLGLVRPQARWGEKFYSFQDLISLRTVRQLTQARVPARRLRRALEALGRQLSAVEVPLTELRIRSNGRNIVVEHGGQSLEPLTGQLLLDFKTRELGEKIRPMRERSAEEWFSLALDYEADPDTHTQAIDAYLRVLEKAPRWLEAYINLGTLFYQHGRLADAADCYRQAVEVDPASALAHFNLGSVLDELGELEAAGNALRTALRLDPAYADAHYNLALVYEKSGQRNLARQHWNRYLELDPHSPWAHYARERLAAMRPPGSM